MDLAKSQGDSRGRGGDIRPVALGHEEPLEFNFDYPAVNPIVSVKICGVQNLPVDFCNYHGLTAGVYVEADSLYDIEFSEVAGLLGDVLIGYGFRIEGALLGGAGKNPSYCIRALESPDYQEFLKFDCSQNPEHEDRMVTHVLRAFERPRHSIGLNSVTAENLAKVVFEAYEFYLSQSDTKVLQPQLDEFERFADLLGDKKSQQQVKVDAGDEASPLNPNFLPQDAKAVIETKFSRMLLAQEFDTNLTTNALMLANVALEILGSMNNESNHIVSNHVFFKFLASEINWSIFGGQADLSSLLNPGF